MQDLLPFIASGLVAGAVFGLAGVGLVLTYRTSGIFNFAHGAIAATAAYFFYWLNVAHAVPWYWAFLLAVGVLGPVVGLAMERFARHLSQQRAAMKIVGTIGVILLVEGLARIKFGSASLVQPSYFPHGTEIVTFGGVNISYAQLTIIAIAVVAVVLLVALFRFSRMGVAMRAVVDDPDLVSLHGTSPRVVRSIAWMLGTSFAALSGVLVSPMLGVEAIVLTYLVAQAFGAAAMGAFTFIGPTYIGGLLLGVGSAVSTKYVLHVEWLSGLPYGLPFIVLFVVLLVTPRKLLQLPTRPEKRAPLQWQGPPASRLALLVVIVVPLLLVPAFASTKISFYTIGLTQAIMILSLGLLVRTAGMVSLCQAAFAAIGAVACSQFISELGMPWVPAVLLGALVVVPIGALLAIPAIRLSGLFLALATFGFGLLIEQMFYARNFMFTSTGLGRVMPRPSFAEGDTAFYFTVLVILALVGVLVEVIHRVRLGRMLEGMAESPMSVSTLGLSTNSVRVLVFCISAFIAGLGGILYGSTVNVVASGDVHFASFSSLVLLALLALSPLRAPWYAIFAIIGAVVPAYWDSPNAANWLNVLFGLFAIMVSLNGGSAQMPESARRLVERAFGWSRRESPAPSGELALVNAARATRSATSGLQLENVTIRYGGHVAVSDFSMSAPSGRITGLIGPNGAGKTTSFNAASGLVPVSSGRIRFDDADITRSSPPQRGRLGIGRTFQIMQLCDSLSVRDNVRLGCEAAQAGANPLRQVFAGPAEKRRADARTQNALELCGIAHLAELQAGDLSTGERRLIDLARCLAGDFEVILLDEPSSGLDPSETLLVAATLRRVVEQRGIGVLIVEHDMSLIMDICDHIYVLDFGKLLFEGDSAQVAVSPVVQAAYLGSVPLDDADQLDPENAARVEGLVSTGAGGSHDGLSGSHSVPESDGAI